MLTNALTKLYDFRDKVCPVDRHIFYPTAEEHLQAIHSLDALENWIQNYADAIKMSAHHANNLGISQNRAIYDYPVQTPLPKPGSKSQWE